jgi:hypothetical protein
VSQGSVRFGAGQKEWIPLLKALYEFEASRLSGSGSWHRDINEIVWSLETLGASPGFTGTSIGELQRLVDWLVQDRMAMRIDRESQGVVYVTRVAELVRLLGHVPEYWPSGRPGTDAIRWQVEYKTVPQRHIPPNEFEASLLETIQADAKAEWQENLTRASKLVVRKVAEVIGGSGTNASFSRFQLEATQEMLVAEFGRKPKWKSQIITAGVGSGKTLAFLIPTLISSLARQYAGNRELRSTLLVYPRRALAINQSEVVDQIVKQIGSTALEAHLEHSDGYSRRNESVTKGIARVYGGVNPPPAVIVTTLETLRRRLQHPLFAQKISKHLKRVVLDEVHLVAGLEGAKVVRLMDRLRVACEKERPGDELLWAASSATVASPQEHAALIFNQSSSEVKVITPKLEDMDQVGIVHHVFVRPSGNISTLGALVNLTSITLHNRRVDIGVRDDESSETNPKSIGFADNLDLLGRWNADLRENERTENVSERPHPNTSNVSAWTPRQREVPYALRFRRPLQTRIEAEGGQGVTILPVLKEKRGENLCKKCQEGQRISLGVKPASVVQSLSELIYRRPVEPKDKLELFSLWNPHVYTDSPQEIGTMDLCPYLRAGACFWFPLEGEASEQIPGTDSYEWKSVARSRIHSSKTQSSEGTVDETLAEAVFRAPVSEVYGIPGDKDVSIDIVLASPSLEVGIDLKNVMESVMFHAIRNVATYRQKVGRVGREPGSDSFNVTLIDNRPIDLHYYRQPRKLISLAQLDPIPLKDRNESVTLNAMYNGVWDWLALNSNVPEAISQEAKPGQTQFSIRLMETSSKLDSSVGEVSGFLSDISRNSFRKGSSEISSAIQQVQNELQFLLTPSSEDIAGTETLADIIPLMLNPKGPVLMLTRDARNLLDELDRHAKAYDAIRHKLNPMSLGLSKEFASLNKMARSGWQLEPIRSCIEAIRRVESGQTGPTKRLLSELEHDLGLIESAIVDWKKNPLSLYFFRQLRKFMDANRQLGYYLSYIMESIEVFGLLKESPEFVRVKNMFTSPYGEEVNLTRTGHTQKVSMDDALFSLIPATWTYRYGARALKVKAGRIRETGGGVLTVSLTELEKVNNQFIKVKEDVRGPPGYLATFDIMKPITLSAFNLKEDPQYGFKAKYVKIDSVSGAVLDGDEAVQGGRGIGRPPYVKVPKSYLNSWVSVKPDEGRPIGIVDLDIDGISILDPQGNNETTGKAAAAKIKHPLASGLLKGMSWHDKLDVTEFVYSVSRTYTSKQLSGVELVFDDPDGRPIGFGQSFETEGLSIELDKRGLEDARDWFVKGAAEGEATLIPSLMRAFASYLASQGIQGEEKVSAFLVRDLVAVATSVIGTSPVTSSNLWKLVSELLEDDEKIRQLAQVYYDKTAEAEEHDTDSVKPGEGSMGRSKADLSTKVNRLIAAGERLRDSLKGFEDYVPSWVVDTLLNSFMVAANNAIQRLAGVTEDAIGCAIDYQGLDQGIYRVFFYDGDKHGNGTTSVTDRFAHILHIQRHGDSLDSELLPTDDFFSLLEEELLQCPQHHADSSALEMFGQEMRGAEPSGLTVVGYVQDQAAEVLQNSRRTWIALGIRGREDMSRLPLLREQAPILARPGRDTEIDDIIRSTTVCWNGCPECLLGGHGRSGGIAAEWRLDKAILDEWVSRGRSRSAEYVVATPQDIADGRVPLAFGNLSKVVLDLKNRRVRSVSLPYTLGIEVPRKMGEGERLVIRKSDIEGLSLFEEADGQPALGIDSHGFKRLFWHDLVLTSYLDMLGLIQAPRRTIRLVFYDLRDLYFEDIGISPRMVEAIVGHAKGKGAFEVPEKISDMLIWLRSRGFGVKICVDKRRLEEEEGVGEMVKRLSAGGCEVFTLSLEGLMHKKILLTPLSAIQGSANLTRGGTGKNEEIVNYAQWGSRGYSQIETNAIDTFHRAVAWRAVN